MVIAEQTKADLALRFFGALRQTKGKWAGQPLALLPWQERIIRDLFGTLRPDGKRQYRTAYIEIPRKAGKSTLSAAIALYLLFEGEPGAEVYCLDPTTRILHDDLTWHPIGDVQVGDSLVGIDEEALPGNTYRRLRRSTVLDVRWQQAETLRLIFDDGREVICTKNHRWMVRPPVGGGVKWRRTSELYAGYRVRNLGLPWASDDSRDAGYLAGMFDGEGYFHSPKASRSAIRVGLAQKPGAVLDKVVSLLTEKGFAIDPPRPQGCSSAYALEIKGLYDVWRFLGQIRPYRLMERHTEVWEGKAPSQSGGFARIVATEDAGVRDVVDIETTTGTFVAEGLVSHNSAAADRDQARIVFEQAKQMVEGSPELSRYAETYRNSIYVPALGASYRVLSADAPTKHGLNAHGIVFDELHAQPNRELWDVLTTSIGAREQPLVVAITTAGYDRESICYELHEYAERVRDGVIDDPSFYPVIFAADEGDAWDDPTTWHKANPSLGVTVQEDFYESEARRAKEMPAYQNTFRRLYLNEWVQQHTRWIDLGLWQENSGAIDEAQLVGRTCYGGLDLGAVSDMTAWVLLFPDDADPERVDVLCRFWTPEARLRDTTNRYRDSYRVWAQEGYLTVEPGTQVQFDSVINQIVADSERFNLVDINLDPGFSAWNVAPKLAEHGIATFALKNTYTNMGQPIRELERRLLARKLNHGGNPVLRWMADGVVVKQGPSGDMLFDKANSQSKIDGIVALTMALDRAMRHLDGPTKSVYETRGIITL